MEWISLLALLVIPAGLLIGWFREWSMMLSLVVVMAILFVLTLITSVDNVTIRGSPFLAELAWRPSYLALAAWPQWFTLISTMFLHANPLHLLMNLVIFIIMGIGLEERLGRGRFLLVFLFTGIMGTLLHSLQFFGQSVPVVGASGAVFGVMGAYASLYPRDKVFFFFILIIPNVPVYIAATVYSVVELFALLMMEGGGVARHAHIGGLLAGFVIAFFLARYTALPELEHRRRVPKHERVPAGSPAAPGPQERKHPPIAELVETDEQKRLYERFQGNRDEPELAAAWLERLAHATKCPRCERALEADRGGLKCTCGYQARD